MENGAEVYLDKSLLTSLIHEVLDEIFYPASFLQIIAVCQNLCFGPVPDKFIKKTRLT